jgi:ribosome-associated heat shock protein Hsp15
MVARRTASNEQASKPDSALSLGLLHPAPERVRIDVWLDVACLFKTRSEAQRACNGGKVEVNDQRAKPHRELRIGDTLTISRPHGMKQRVVVRRLADTHVPKAIARELYEDTTPPPTPEEQAFRELLRNARQTPPSSPPDKRARRLLRQMKERDR